jgi:hypothetical protein
MAIKQLKKLQEAEKMKYMMQRVEKPPSKKKLEKMQK